MPDVSQIDGISMVLGALAASASAGAGEGVKQTTKDTVLEVHKRLVGLLHSRLHRNPDGQKKLAEYEAEPTERNREALREHLVAAGIGRDSEIIGLAQLLKSQTGPHAYGTGSVAAGIIIQSGESNRVGGV